MSTVFVTGGAGLIGAHLTRDLLDRGHRVTVFDNFQQYVVPPTAVYFENVHYRLSTLLKGAEVVRGSTANKDELRRALAQCEPEYVVHLASLPLAGIAVRSPEEALQSILCGTTNLLDSLRELPTLTKLTHISSSMAYGDFVTTPIAESADKDPIELYGAMKLASEIVVRAYHRQYGIPYVIVRPSAVYGPSDNNYRVVQILLERAFRGLPVRVEDPDTTFLDFTYVTDIARGLALATLTPDVVAEDFNITYGRGRSLAELTEILRNHFPGLQVDVGPKSERFRPMRGTLDISKARQMLGYAPQVSLEEGVAAYIDYMTSNNVEVLKNV